MCGCSSDGTLKLKLKGKPYLYCGVCRGKTPACRVFCLPPPSRQFCWRFLQTGKTRVRAEKVPLGFSNTGWGCGGVWLPSCGFTGVALDLLMDTRTADSFSESVTRPGGGAGFSFAANNNKTRFLNSFIPFQIEKNMDWRGGGLKDAAQQVKPFVIKIKSFNLMESDK